MFEVGCYEYAPWYSHVEGATLKYTAHGQDSIGVSPHRQLGVWDIIKIGGTFGDSLGVTISLEGMNIITLAQLNFNFSCQVGV